MLCSFTVSLCNPGCLGDTVAFSVTIGISLQAQASKGLLPNGQRLTVRLSYFKVNLGNVLMHLRARLPMAYLPTYVFITLNIMDVLENNEKFFYITFQEVWKLQRISITANAREWCPLALYSVAAQMITSIEHGLCSQTVLGSNSSLTAY